jgi:hypothetical protein
MITFEGILIGTGILWALNLILVMPLTNLLVSRWLARPALANITGGTEAPAGATAPDSVVTGCYMLADTLVLGVAGFLFGALLGWFFIGISFEFRGWPGMIAFIAMSMIGASM